MPHKLADVDLETSVNNEPSEDKNHLRLWLRLLSCTNLITAEIRRDLRTQTELTLPRFDVLAQLYQEPKGLRLSELSKRLMVTNGNVTGLTDRLVDDGYVCRVNDHNDRRASVIRLTKLGSKTFEKLASAHETWLAHLFDGLSAETIQRLMNDLATLKHSVVEGSVQPPH